MATTADGHDKKSPNTNQFSAFFSLRINLFTSHGNRIHLFFFKTFYNISQKLVWNQRDSLMKETQSGTDKLFFCCASARRQRCTSDALINIYECVFDAAFKVPSTQHLSTASLYSGRPSPRAPVLKQSIIKEQPSAITLSDPNGISSGTLKAAIFLCRRHDGKCLCLIWSL